ncbi:MAG: glycosyltransferase 87 family protein [Acidobacteriaceae bacterium]
MWMRGLSIPKWAEAAVLLVVAALFSITVLAPSWRTLNTDFPNYYVAASLFRAGVPLDRAYEWEWFQRQKDHLRVPQPLVGFAPHPPLCALPVVPLTFFSPLVAKRVWTILNSAFLVATMMLLAHLTLMRLWQIATLFMVFLIPLRSNFMLGQYYVLLLALICLAYYLQQQDRKALSGVMLAVAASLKLFPAGFLLLFLWKRNWKSAFGLIGGLIALSALSIALFGLDAHWVYLTQVLPRTLSGDLLGPYVPRSYTGLWHRLFIYEPELNPTPLLSSPTAYIWFRILAPVLLTGYYLLKLREGEANAAMDWSGMLFLLVLLSPMPASYHYCVLILGFVLSVGVLRERGQLIPAALLTLLSLFTFAPKVPDLVRLLLLTLLFLLLMRFGFSPLVVRSRRLKLSLVILGLLIVSSASTLSSGVRASDRLFRSMPFPAGYRAANPVAASHTIAFTQMVGTGYRAIIGTNNQAVWLPPNSDALSLAASRESPWLYYELAGARSSIWRIRTDGANSAQYVTQGQQPYLSHNAEWLLFIREQHGTGHLWLRSIRTSTERQLTFDSFNVLEATVNDAGEVIASVGPVATPSLVSIASKSPSAGRLLWSRDDRYPAYSPDGARLAYSHRTGGAWHLRVRNLVSGAEQQLTRGPCNSSQPFWEDTEGTTDVLYATDCGRGLGLSAIAQVAVPQAPAIH